MHVVTDYFFADCLYIYTFYVIRSGLLLFVFVEQYCYCKLFKNVFVTNYLVQSNLYLEDLQMFQKKTIEFFLDFEF